MAQQLIAEALNREVTELRIAELEEQLAAERARLVAPVEPLGKDAVVRFTKYSSGYTFAALKISTGSPFTPATWYITQDGSRSSRQGHAPKTWAELLQWIGERNWHTIEVLS